MISRDHIQTLIDRPANGSRILSAFLDMSVNSDNKRTHEVFLNKEKAEFRELASERENHSRSAIGDAFARLERWVSDNYDEANKGLAVYVELDGDWLQGLQLPLPVKNRLAIDERPVVGPLVEMVSSYHHHGVVLVDREHLRILSLYMDQAIHERAVETEPFPAPHDIKRGGFSARDYQQRKEEETRHFFKEFALEIEDFHRRFHPDDLILLGTPENVKRFQEFLADSLRQQIVHTTRCDIEATSTEVLEILKPFFQQMLDQEETEAVNLLRDRVREGHLAVAGFDDTLEQLQEGKVERLILARDLEGEGGRCQTCGFFLARSSGSCPYCGGTVTDGVDLVEQMVRIAGDKGTPVDFVSGSRFSELPGVGALLRFQ